MKNALKLKIYHKKLLLTKLSSLKYSQTTLFAVAVLLAGILTVVFYHSLFPTEAATNTVTVTDNNQT
ncbi:MAG: hypothetical protein LBQ02_03010, partial [Candidatus Nomurabacteria bacterium]|nr:hypothetical protein [Candidatus Nomurabacteria bacterium]